MKWTSLNLMTSLFMIGVSEGRRPVVELIFGFREDMWWILLAAPWALVIPKNPHINIGDFEWREEKDLLLLKPKMNPAP